MIKNHAPCALLGIALLVLLTAMPALVFCQQQQADPNFDTKVARPAYTTTHPKVLFDEAHNNFHTVSARYKPFADLATNDGYVLTPNKEKFQQSTLAGYDILVIANALGSEQNAAAGGDNPAFTEDECDAVREWVRGGSALLLIADHSPFGGAAANLGARFGVDMSKGYAADPVNYQRIALNTSWVVYSRRNKALTDHPITRGRDNNERINLVMSFTGQSLKGPKESVALLKLSADAYDVLDINAPERAKIVSAAGRAQALAMPFGKGRVIVFGEAAMLTAQNVNFGMNYPGTDNKQFMLNVMHWLSGLLK
jgi:hypothetical protein